jgi:hypothetical protein
MGSKLSRPTRPNRQNLHQRGFLLIPVDNQPKPLVWSGLEMGIDHSDVFGIKKLDIPMVSGIIGGVRFRKVKESP